jgi:hypothetical protein
MSRYKDREEESITDRRAGGPVDRQQSRTVCCVQARLRSLSLHFSLTLFCVCLSLSACLLVSRSLSFSICLFVCLHLSLLSLSLSLFLHLASVGSGSCSVPWQDLKVQLVAIESLASRIANGGETHQEHKKKQQKTGGVGFFSNVSWRNSLFFKRFLKRRGYGDGLTPE